jgi:hypothetical protein
MSALLQIVQEHLRASATSPAPPPIAPTAPAAPVTAPSRRRRAAPSTTPATADGAGSPADARPARKPGPRPAERTLANASEQARRVAAVILDVLAGTRSTTEAATALQISAARYYQIETRALAGLVNSCAPGADRPRGRLANPANVLARLEQENRRLRQELQRAQALARISQRSLGLTAPKERAPARPDGKPGTKRRRPTVRAMRAAQRIRPSTGAADAGSPQPATPAGDQRGG